MPDSRIPRDLFAPRYWPSWLLLAVWFLLAQLPYRVQWLLAHLLSPLLRLNKKRLRIARTNLRLCFPELSEAERERILRENLFSTTMAVMETGIAWFWPAWRLRGLYRVSGLEHLSEREEGQGALLLSLHFTTLDLGSAMLGQHIIYDGMYTPHKNKVFDAVQKNRREKYSEGGLTIPRTSVRTMVSHLRRGRMIWYAPDRDLGPKVSIFVPFFGVPAATVTATGTFARMGQARVIPFTQRRLDKARGYELVIHPPFEDYPTGDEYQDALRVNEFMEREIRKCPEQYFWAQPRFKTRPPGEPPVYRTR